MRFRLALPLILIGALAVALAARVVWVGVIDADTFAQMGREKREHRIVLHEMRGSILDRNGEALVMSVPTKLVAADPAVVDNPDATATALAALLNVPRESLINSLERPDSRYSIVARQVSPEIADKIQAAKLPGIVLDEDPQRVAVNDVLARSVLGSMDRYATTAHSGIELLFDEQLRPVEGEEKIERGIGGSTIPGSERVVKVARPGSDVTLTLDRAVQFMAEKELAKQVAAVGAKGGTVIVGRPQTGEILAMASVARKDGVAGAEVIQGSLNQSVRLYEPGSVMKVVTVATAIDQGLVTPATSFVVPDKITLYDRTIKDAESHKTMSMTVEQILAESSNVGTIKIAQKIEAANGLRSFNRSLRSFGFGKMTSLGLPKEQAGEVKKIWNGTDVGSIPIGQSITVSPAQMWSAYNVIANRGLYVAPKLVRDVVDAEGRHIAPVTPKPHRVISPASADMVTRSLEKVIEEGTGKEWKIPGFNIAAKTGTAYKVLDNGTYGSPGNRKYAASFVGFFPASNPQISIMVMVDEPQYGNHFGAIAAGPVFDALARETMRRFSIAGDTKAATSGQAGPVRSQPAAPTTVAPTTAPPTTVAPAAPAPTSAPAPAAPSNDG